MTVKERILALSLIEMAKGNEEFIKSTGVKIRMNEDLNNKKNERKEN